MSVSTCDACGWAKCGCREQDGVGIFCGDTATLHGAEQVLPLSRKAEGVGISPVTISMPAGITSEQAVTLVADAIRSVSLRNKRQADEKLKAEILAEVQVAAAAAVALAEQQKPVRVSVELVACLAGLICLFIAENSPKWGFFWFVGMTGVTTYFGIFLGVLSRTLWEGSR